MKLLRGDRRKGLLSKSDFIGVQKECSNCNAIMEIESAGDIEYEPVRNGVGVFYITCICCGVRNILTGHHLKAR